jgi:hypothetical protein
MDDFLIDKRQVRMAFALGRVCKQTRTRQGFQTGSEVVVYAQIGIFVIIQSGAPQLFIIQRKSEWPDQMQLRPGVGAQANDVPGIRRNLRLEEDHIKHFGSFRCK